MFADAQLMYSDAQGLTATGASTNTVDHGVPSALGAGEGLVAVVVLDAAMGGTAPTITVTVETDDNSGFATPTAVAASATLAAPAAGTRILVPVPATAVAERYTRLLYTLGGTGPTATVTAFLQPESLVSHTRHYPDAVNIA